MNRIIKLISVLVCISSGISAQHAGDDFKKINNFYKNTQVLTVNQEYKVFRNNKLVPEESLSGSIKKSGDNIYHKMGSVEIFNTKTYTLSVDHSEKTIILLKKQTAEASDVLNLDIADFLKTCENIKYSDVSSTEGRYFLECSNSQYSGIELVFNKKKFFMSRLILKQKIDEDDIRLEISYTGINTAAEVPSDFFNISRFLIKKGDKYEPVGQYKDYEFLNR